MKQREPRRSRTGRPTKLTQAIQAAICRDLEIAVPLKYAAEANDVPESTVYDWIARGERGAQPFADFARAVTRSVARSVRNLTRKALAGGPGSSAATWSLERRFPKYYGARQKVEIAGVDGHELEFQFGAIIDPDTRAVLEAALGRADHASLAIG